jgi:hypothetical protein
LHPFPKFSGLLRSSHALIGLLALLCLAFFVAGSKVPIVANTSYGLFVLIVLSIVGRYLLKGPEADHRLPSITVSQTMVSIANISVGSMQTTEFQALIAGLIQSRRPLPAPAGILKGPSSDPNAIQRVSQKESEELQSKDNV